MDICISKILKKGWVKIRRQRSERRLREMVAGSSIRDQLVPGTVCERGGGGCGHGLHGLALI